MKRNEDLTGKVFGYLTVIEFSHKGKLGRTMWLCRCVCGNTRIVSTGDLNRSDTISCGCKKGELISKKVIRDLNGQKFNRWTVLSFAYIKEGKAWWNCKCDCGTERVIMGTSIVTGGSQSCGCARVDFATENNTTHGLSKHPVYSVWRHIHSRCRGYNPNDIPCYVDKGITVCERWSGPEGFVNFLKDMGERPEGTQIDRIDNSKGYSSENCRWVTCKENQRNRGTNRNITFNGKTQCMSAWSEELGMYKGTIRERLERGWSEERALTTLVDIRCRPKKKKK